MMNSLEVELGLNLLQQKRRKLGSGGHGALPRMRQFLDSAEELERDVDRIRQRGFSTLFGAYSSTARHWIPEMLSEFRSDSGNVQVSLTMNSMESLYAAVKADELTAPW